MSSTPKVGAFVLETLTTGMYTNPLDTIREYIQNGLDAILEIAPTSGNMPGTIEIEIDSTYKQLVIRDNGAGVPHSQVRDRLVNIGMSNKDLTQYAGFRGIGRLAGIAYCRRLIFRTKAFNETVESSVEYECEDIKRSLLPGMRQVAELTEVLEKHTKVEQRSLDNDPVSQHYFEVIMDGISEDIFLNWASMETYLSQVAPVNFDAQRFLYAPRITEWVKENHVILPTIRLVLRDLRRSQEREIFKPYTTTTLTTRPYKGMSHTCRIEDIIFFPDAPYREDTRYWIWYAKTPLLGSIEDKSVAGFRLRLKNIAIGGPERVEELFSLTHSGNARFNAWYIGEIHILSSQVIPNARRDGFEDVGDWPNIKKELLEFINERVRDVRNTSQKRNMPVAKLSNRVNSFSDTVKEELSLGIIPQPRRQKLIEQGSKLQKAIEEAIGARTDPGEKQKLTRIQKELVDTLTKLSDQEDIPSQNFVSSLDRKQRKLIMEILTILHSVLDEDNYLRAEKAILERYGRRSS